MLSPRVWVAGTYQLSCFAFLVYAEHPYLGSETDSVQSLRVLHSFSDFLLAISGAWPVQF